MKASARYPAAAARPTPRHEARIGLGGPAGGADDRPGIIRLRSVPSAEWWWAGRNFAARLSVRLAA